MKGKLVAKDGSNTINVTEVITYMGIIPSNFEYWQSYIAGSVNMARVLFNKRDWDFIEDRPSNRDQVRALKKGTTFRFEGEAYEYIKVSDYQVARSIDSNPLVDLRYIDDEFSALSTEKFKVIE